MVTLGIFLRLKNAFIEGFKTHIFTKKNKVQQAAKICFIVKECLNSTFTILHILINKGLTAIS